MTQGVTFKLKENEASEVVVHNEEIQEIVPDADFRFSLIIMKNGDKHFVYGTRKELEDKLQNESG